MKGTHLKTFFLALGICLICQLAWGQEQRQEQGQRIDTVNFLNALKSYDVSAILIDTNTAFGTGGVPLGYIGHDFQRFLIHFDQIRKMEGNPNQYLVRGRTMVKTNRCDFTGSITLQDAYVYPSLEEPSLKEGIIIAKVYLEETKGQFGAGVITGILTTQFIIDSVQVLRYNDLFYGADGYAGRQFEGNWRSDKTGLSKVCNWGDDRIAHIKGSRTHIDVGDGEFWVNPLYRNNGWDNYCQAWQDDIPLGDPKLIKARAFELNWWR